MLPIHRKTITAIFADALAQIAPDAPRVPITLERPAVAAMGDVASNIALQLSKPLRVAPRTLAQQIAQAVQADARAKGLIEEVDIAGPGFINIRLSKVAHQSVVSDILRLQSQFGMVNQGSRSEPSKNSDEASSVLIEFVSANPTGPLHVGHGRQAVLGDTLSNILNTQGKKVHREFYYNDAGVQIQTLANSVQARARGLTPQDAEWPKEAYNGDYIADIAQAYLQSETVCAKDGSPVQANADVEDLETIRRFAVTYLRHEQDVDLQTLGVYFDRYYLESSLYTEGRVEATVQALIHAGKTYESDGALWLRTTEEGDDKDRVMRKSNGDYTYFVPDVAYHVTKWERGFKQVINIQGSDHHGTVARVRAGLQHMGLHIPKGYPDYILHKMVTVVRNHQIVKISKRAGGYVTVRDLIEWSSGIGAPVETSAAVGFPESENALSAPDSRMTASSAQADPLQRGRDAVRFFLISRKADTEFVFDIDVALQRNDENPVYYVQYAHARICSVLVQAEDISGDVHDLSHLAHTLSDADLAVLSSDSELALMQRLAEYPDVLERAANELSPHFLAFYLRTLAAAFHSFYNAERVLVEDIVMRRARLALLAATRQVFVNGLGLLGVSTPTKM